MRNGNSSIHQRIASRFDVDHRAALLNSRGGGVRSSDASRRNEKNAAVTKEAIEQQMHGEVEDLEAKVGTLRDISLLIGKETRESLTILDGLKGHFDKAGGMLKGTVDHMKEMISRKGGTPLCYLFLFMIALFFLMYMIRGMGSKPAGGANLVVPKESSPLPGANGR